MADMKRWNVTYTKHVRQKRKVYQDGVLQLSGSGNKVMLFDDCEKPIDSKFLKKDEVIQSGGTLALETHLVDIGGPEGKCNPLAGVNVCGRNVRSNEINGTKEQKEWNALYTTQITQKAKRYHDGILRLSVCGSQLNQVTLLNEDGEVLASKYLKSVESLRTENKLEMPNYLIEICEPRILQKDQKEGPEQVISSSSDCGKPMGNRQVLARKPLANGLLKHHSEQVMGPSSSSASKMMNRRISMSMKPSCSVDLKKDPSQQDASSSSSSVAMFRSNRKIIDLETTPSEQVPGSDNSSVRRHTINEKLISNKPPRNACQILSILSKSMPEENRILKKVEIEQMHSSEFLDFILLDTQSKDKESHVPEVDCFRKTLKKDSKEDNEGLDIGVSTQIGASENSCRELRVSQEVLFSCVATLKGTNDQPHNYCAVSSLMGGCLKDDTRNIDSVKDQDSNQTDAGNIKAEGCERNLSLGASSPGYAGSDTNNKVSELQILTKNYKNVDDCPTFDLGF